MSFTWQGLRTVAIEPLGWMIVHSIWQLACLAAFYAIVRHGLQRSSPVVRYRIACVTLATMVVATVATFVAVVPPFKPTVPAFATVITDGNQSKVELGATAPPDSEDPTSDSLGLPYRSSDSEERAEDYVSHGFSAAALIERYLPWIVVPWAVAVLLISVWNLGGWIAVQRMTRLGVRPVLPSIERQVNRLRKRLAVSRSVRVVESFVVRAPSVVGWLSPVILLPVGIMSGLTPAQLEAVLAHELAHIRRLDYLANLLQTVVETLFFYHPAVHYLSRQMRLEREYCADALALLVVHDRLAYAKTLSEIGDRIAESPQFILAATGGNLVHRVRRILSLETNDGGRTASWLVGAATSLTILVGLAFAPTVHAAMAESAVPKISMRRVWTHQIDEVGGTISPNGRYIAHTNWYNGNLVVHDLETEESREVTTEGSWERPVVQYADNAIWSPDSTQIAYAWFRGKRSQIRVVGLEDNEPRVVVPLGEGGYAFPLDWSRDGSSILANIQVDASGDDVVALANVADGSLHRILKLPPNSLDVALSPNGQWVAYTRKANGSGRDIFLYDMVKEESTPLLQHPADDRSLWWSPDGRWLTFISKRSGNGAAWMIPFDVESGEVGRARQLSPEAISSYIMGITDRGEVAFAVTGPRSDIYQVGYDPDGDTVLGQPQLLVQLFEGRNDMPVWSGDGTRLAFFSNRPLPRGGSQMQIVVRDERTGQESFPRVRFRQPHRLPTKHLAWHPDGRRLFIYGTMQDGQGDYVDRILAYDVESHDAVPILTKKSTNPSAICHVFAISADGESIFYGKRMDDGSVQLMRQSIRERTEQIIAIVHGLGELHSMQVSPDARRLALATSSALSLINLHTREQRLLLRAGPTDQEMIMPGIAWTAAGDYLLFARHQVDSPPRTRLMRIAVAGGEPQPLNVRLSEAKYLTVHASGRLLAFAGKESRPGVELWYIEHSWLSKEE